MSTTNFLTVKDYLNYYIAGVVWLIDVLLLLLPVGDQGRLAQSLAEINQTLSIINAIFIAVAILVFPYIIGFVLNPLCSRLTEIMNNKFKDPKALVVNYRSDILKGKRLWQPHLKLVTKEIRSVFKSETFKDESVDNWFYLLRAYISNDKGGKGLLADRAKDMMNFAESLILPVPLFFFILGFRLWSFSWQVPLVLFMLGLVTLCLIGYRYRYLRGNWAKHVYRAFLAITYEIKDKKGETFGEQTLEDIQLTSIAGEVKENV